MFGQKRGASVSHWSVAVIASCLVIGLSGCVSEEVRDPSLTSSPAGDNSFFASDDEALMAGVDGYNAYLKVSDEITAGGGAGGERIKPFVSEELLPSFVEGYESLSRRQIRSVGSTQIDSERLQTWSAKDGVATVSFYVCVDVSQVRIIDATGNDVTPAERALRTPIVATVNVSDSTESHVLTGNEPWSGESFC